MGFFDQFDRFFTTSQTSPFPHRLNGRHAAIIERHAERFVNQRVLDIASHDGRWAFAALQAGAAYVYGVEPRADLVQNAYDTCAHYGIERTRYDFACGDAFTLLNDAGRFDIVLCLGFFYHTARHAELFDLIERTGAAFVVLDTEVTPADEEIPITPNADPRLIHRNPYAIQLLREPVDDQQMACADAATRGGYTLVGRPSRAAVTFIAAHFGYTTEQYCWQEYLAAHPEAESAMIDYKQGWRETFSCHKQRSR